MVSLGVCFLCLPAFSLVSVAWVLLVPDGFEFCACCSYLLFIFIRIRYVITLDCFLGFGCLVLLIILFVWFCMLLVYLLWIALVWVGLPVIVGACLGCRAQLVYEVYSFIGYEFVCIITLG